MSAANDFFRPREWLTPLRRFSASDVSVMILLQVMVALVFWITSRAPFLPTPGEVWRAFAYLWSEDGLLFDLLSSLWLNIESLLIATVISLLIAYASIIPAFRPVTQFLGKLRFLSLYGLTFFFALETANGHQLKVALLVFSVSVFYVTGMADVIDAIPKEQFDLARTLRMGNWRASYEVVVLGQADKAFDVLRNCAAMSWMMLSMVETISREGGGIGAKLADQNKHFNMAAVFSIQITILLIGIAQDYSIGALKKFACPYAFMTLERK